MSETHTVSTFCQALRKKKNFILASHVNPEGDAVACVLAMDSLLRRLGKNTMIVCEDPFPERLSCIYSDRWKQAKDVTVDSRFDALVVADCPTIERIGETRKFITPETVIFNIDHHLTNKKFGRFNLVAPKASACGEVVYDIFKYFRMALTKEEARAIYVSITTDTGSFKYSNTTTKSHRIAAELIQKGIDIEKINEDLYATYNIRRMKLYSRLLGRVETAFDGQVAWAGMKKEDLKHSGATYEDAEGFIDFLKYIREVQFAFFLIELPSDNMIRASLRAKGNYDVSKVAAHFGGGGHQKASGCNMSGTIEHNAELVLAEIKKEIDRHRR